ncbi:MAG: acyl carrier protein [Gaiellaceae bacterium]
MFDTIRHVLVTQFDARPDDVRPDSELEPLLQDSLDLVEFGSALGDLLSIQVADDELGGVSTIQDLIQLLETKGGARA